MDKNEIKRLFAEANAKCEEAEKAVAAVSERVSEEAADLETKINDLKDRERKIAFDLHCAEVCVLETLAKILWDCGVVKIKIDAEKPDIFFSGYWYQSGLRAKIEYVLEIQPSGELVGLRDNTNIESFKKIGSKRRGILHAAICEAVACALGELEKLIPKIADQSDIHVRLKEVRKLVEDMPKIVKEIRP